jgi:predicted amidohydrolase YtcJ
VVENLGKGEWITGGKWGACEQWSLGSAGSDGERVERWKPDRWMIDDLTPDNPVLLWNFDRSMYLANTLALEISGADHTYPEGMEYIDGKGLTGIIFSHSPKLQMVKDAVVPFFSNPITTSLIITVITGCIPVWMATCIPRIWKKCTV